MTRQQGMSVPLFIKSAARSNLTLLGAEEIEINGTKVRAVCAEIDQFHEMGVGAKNRQREIEVQFVTGDVAIRGDGKDIAVIRGEKWKIASERGAASKGQALTTVRFIEPERRGDA